MFLWRQHQERTHTWFGMFDAEGRETAAVEVMRHAWTGRWPENRTPRLDSVKLDGKGARAGLALQPGQTSNAEVWVRDPDGEPARIQWEILREGTDFPYGGNGEKRPPAVPGLISNPTNGSFRFKPHRKRVPTGCSYTPTTATNTGQRPMCLFL